MEENYRIQELIETKMFHELTPEEKLMVLKDLSEEEYNLRKSVVENTRAFLAEGVGTVKTSDHIKQRAALILKEKQKQEKTWMGAVLQYKIPAFIPAAAAVLLLLMLPFAFNNQTEKVYIAQAKDTIRTVVYKTDTVVLEKETIKQVPVTVVKKVQIPSVSVNALTNQGTDRVVTADPKTITNQIESQLKKQSNQSGLSSGDMNALNRFLRKGDTISDLNRGMDF